MSEDKLLFNSIFLNEKEGEVKNLEYVESYLCNFNSNKDKIRHINIILPTKHIDEVKNNFNCLLDLPIDSFEVEKEIDDAVYKFEDIENLKYYSTICNTVNNNPNSEKMSTLNEIPSPNNLAFIIHKMRYKTNTDTQEFFIIAKQDRVALNKKKSIFVKTDEDFTETDSNKYYIFNPYITCIFLEEDVFVVNYKTFINLFKYKEYLKIKVENTINLFLTEGIISNFKDYEDSLNSYRNFNALTKVSQDPNEIKSFLENTTYTEKIKKIETQYECHFKFDIEKKSFSISNEQGLKIMIRILSNRAGFDFSDNPVTFANKYSLQKKETFVPTK